MGVPDERVEAASDGVSLGDDRATVVVRKVHTRNGERLEIATADGRDRIRIDALALESVSWQTPGDLAADLLGDPAAPRSAPSVPSDGALDTLGEFTVVNEFSEVSVRAARADGGAFLEITAPKVGHRIRLAPALLAGLARRETDLFSGFLETPYGPE